jgi:hypothetical protein
MPLLDHFRPPIWNRSSWQGLHGGWPMVIVQQMQSLLPDGFVAEPRVNLGSHFEIDVCTFEEEHPSEQPEKAPQSQSVTQSATRYAVAEPTLATETEITEEYCYEVLIFDETRDRSLVAAIELVSPGNKDRVENREAFVRKCLALLRQEVCVTIVDLVTIRQFNLYGQLLETLQRTQPGFSATEPSIYASTSRYKKRPKASQLDSWAYALQLGEKLPTLPIWLGEDRAIPLDLESSYWETCIALRIAR